MAVNKPDIYQPGLYFLTFTNYKWLPLIRLTNSYDLVYKWFDHLKGKGHHIAGYVIMPNHIHALIGFAKSQSSINKIVGNGKRFIAYKIVARLRSAGNEQMLGILRCGVSHTERKRGKLHQVFESSFDIKECYTLPFIRQKLDYMHNNPVSKKWSLAPDTISYVHSSAKFYETGTQGIYNITNFIELFDKDWMGAPSAQLF